MSLEIVTVNNVPILCHMNEGVNFVAIKSICKALQIDYQKQYDRIRRDPILRSVYTNSIPVPDSTDQKKQAMICLPVKYLYGWLFSIQESKINTPEMTEFIKYKMVFYDLLYEHFYMKASLYDRKEKLIAKKESILNEQIKQKIEISENIAKIKKEIHDIRLTPVAQLTLFE